MRQSSAQITLRMRTDEAKGQKKASRHLQVLKLHLITGCTFLSISRMIPSIRIPFPIKNMHKFVFLTKSGLWCASPRVAVIKLINHMQICQLWFSTRFVTLIKTAILVCARFKRKRQSRSGALKEEQQRPSGGAYRQRQAFLAAPDALCGAKRQHNCWWSASTLRWCDALWSPSTNDSW